jgi:hypothetical protein
MPNELPRPFDNDDEEAFPDALGRLNQALHDAGTRAEQDAAIGRIKRFLEHQREKREYRVPPPSLVPPTGSEADSEQD